MNNKTVSCLVVILVINLIFQPLYAFEYRKEKINDSLVFNVKSWNDIQAMDSKHNFIFKLGSLVIQKPKKIYINKGRVLRKNQNGTDIQYFSSSYRPNLQVRGQIIESDGVTKFTFSLSGFPSKIKSASAFLTLKMAKDAVFEKLTKLGAWRQQPFGGVPYEVPDGTLLQWRLKDKVISFAYNNYVKFHEGVNLSNKVKLVFHPDNKGRLKATFSTLINKIGIPPRIVAARWHDDSLGKL